MFSAVIILMFSVFVFKIFSVLPLSLSYPCCFLPLYLNHSPIFMLVWEVTCLIMLFNEKPYVFFFCDSCLWSSEPLYLCVFPLSRASLTTTVEMLCNLAMLPLALNSKLQGMHNFNKYNQHNNTTQCMWITDTQM